jgi:DHA1 family tetracycline resistance protein-like MFS transporter
MADSSATAGGGSKWSRQASVPFILVTLFLDVLGFGLLIPVGPKLVQHLLGEAQALASGAAVGGGIAHDASSGEASPYVAALMATYAAMQLVFAPILGGLSDRFGRRPLILIALLGSGIDYFAMALAPTLWFLFITRAVNGLTGASMTVCSAYIADVTPPEKRAASFGMMGAAFGIGFIVGPALGGILGKIDIHLPFYAAGALTLCNWLYGCFVLPESVPPQRRTGFQRLGEGVLSWAWHTLREANPVRAVSHLRRYPMVGGMALALFLMNLAMFGLHATWALYTAARYGWDETHVGLSLTAVGVCAAIVQGGLAKRLIPALGHGATGERRAVILGVAIGVLAYLGYGAAPEGWMIYATVAFASLGGIAQPASQALITKSVRPTEQGLIQGALTSTQSVAQIFGPLIASIVYKHAVSPDAKPPFNHPGLSFFLGAILTTAGLFIIIAATRGVEGRIGRTPGLDAAPPAH